MKYFIDTEFHEGIHKPLFNKPRHFIDLISIGMVAEDGREYYAISNEFNIDWAWNKWQPRKGQGDRNNTDPREYWLRENVLRPIFIDTLKSNIHLVNLHQVGSEFTLNNFKHLIKAFGKSNKQIASDIVTFCNPDCIQQLKSGLWPDQKELALHKPDKNGNAQPEFYGWYCDYDWVLLCSMFGRMMDLPDGFPKYCRDLKQTFDEKAYEEALWAAAYHNGGYPKESDHIKKMPGYPKQVNEHNALYDARWTKQLHDFLLTIKKGF